MKDLIIIGAGPAGISAAIYGKRAGLDLVVLERFAPGGQVMNTAEVENYPGFVDPIAGWDLVTAMENQAKRLEAEFESAEVTSVEKDNNIFKVNTSSGKIIEGKSVIVCTGASWKKLGVPGEEEFTGKGVSYCATCDGAFYKDKITAVIGGGNTALEEAEFLTKFASKVYLVHRRDEFRGSKILQERILKNEKIIPVYNSVVESINGEAKVNSITVLNRVENRKSNIETDGVFIFVGIKPNTDFVEKSLLDDNGSIKVDMQMRTSVDGFFAAGDLRSESRRQIVMAAADGAVASMNAYEYVTNKEL